jgi:dolichol-phosphate mannosyltransferase
MTEQSLEFSVVIPAFNESESIPALLEEMLPILFEQAVPFEVLVVDDGSTDGTSARVREIAKRAPAVRALRHKTRLGKTAALRTGVLNARGKWIAILDADGQNDPRDVRRLWGLATEQEVEEPLLIIGRRRTRKDPTRRLVASWAWNAFLRLLLRESIHDSSCGLAAFRASDFNELPHFDHMHRYFPALFIRAGGRVIWMDINSRGRLGGRSNYSNTGRLWEVFVDSIGVLWLMRRAVPKSQRVTD